MWEGGQHSRANEPTSFFYLTLKTGDAEAIRKMFARLRADAKAMLKEAVELSWYMRGSIQYDKFFDMTPMERDAVKDFITSHMENVKDHAFPVY